MTALLKDKSDIIDWLNQYNIKNYTLRPHAQYRFVVDVDGNVNLVQKALTSIDVKFNHITGAFDCSDNELISLQGSPRSVGSHFYCIHNHLTSLAHCPKIIQSSFLCFDNQITSLQGSPRHIGGDFMCARNLLTSLLGGPATVGGGFNCAYNQLTHLQGAPQIIEGDFHCNDNLLLNLKYAPKKIFGKFNCSDNLLAGPQDYPQFTGLCDLSNNPGLGPYQKASQYLQIQDLLLIDLERQSLHAQLGHDFNPRKSHKL